MAENLHIGIAGTGRMGAAMAGRLLSLNHPVTVWNRTVEKTEALAAAGAKVAATPAELAAKSDVVITILTNVAASDVIYHGADGLLAGDVRDKLFIDMSTVRPQAAQALAEKVKAKRAAFIECPVGGTVGPAREGKLLGLAGGDATDVARAQPILAQLCRRFEHVGPVGAGASMKLAINLPLFVFWRAFAEALKLCRHLGRDPAWLIDLFADTSGGPNVLKVRGPALAAVLAGKDPGPPTFDIDLVRKDLQTMMEEGKALGIDLPLVARTRECYDAAARDGWGSRDVATVLNYWLDGGKLH